MNHSADPFTFQNRNYITYRSRTHSWNVITNLNRFIFQVDISIINRIFIVNDIFFVNDTFIVNDIFIVDDKLTCATACVMETNILIDVSYYQYKAT